MRKLIYTISSVLFATALVAQPCSTQQVKDVLLNWGNTLSKLNPHASASEQYASNATLMGTYAKTSVSTEKEREDYFKFFIGDNKAMKVSFDEQKIIINNGTSVASGIYTFTITDSKNSIKNVKARYTYILENRAEGCKIISHHSSAVPDKAV